MGKMPPRVRISARYVGSSSKVFQKWLIMQKMQVSLCRTLTRESFLKAKVTTNPWVSVHQGVSWVSGQCLSVSEPTQSEWGPQAKFSKSG